MEFEYPIVNTIYSLQQVYKAELRDRSDEYIIDLGYSIPIFSFSPFQVCQLKPHEAVYQTEFYLLLLSNAYKWVEEYLLGQLLYDMANEIRKRSLGSVITDYDYMVQQAIINKDTIKVEPNKEIRFLPNPTYRRKIGEGRDEYGKDNIGVVGTNQYDWINQNLAQDKRDENYTKIKNAISDYSLTRKTLYKVVLAKEAGLSVRTIKTYLNEHPELKEMYEAVKKHSGTQEQQYAREQFRKKTS